MPAFDLSETRGPWVVLGSRDRVVIQEQLAALEAQGGRLHHFRAEDLGDEAGVFRTFAQELRFPAYFGRNWDAMVDCLDDLCGAVTGGGVGMTGVIHHADSLLGLPFLRTFVSVLCQGADRANRDVGLDGDPLDRPAIVLHFALLLDDVPATDFVAEIEHQDLIVSEEQGFVTVTLNPDVWFT